MYCNRYFNIEEKKDVSLDGLCHLTVWQVTEN
jgi:hypothetical protein